MRKLVAVLYHDHPGVVEGLHLRCHQCFLQRLPRKLLEEFQPPPARIYLLHDDLGVRSRALLPLKHPHQQALKGILGKRANDDRCHAPLGGLVERKPMRPEPLHFRHVTSPSPRHSWQVSSPFARHLSQGATDSEFCTRCAFFPASKLDANGRSYCHTAITDRAAG